MRTLVGFIACAALLWAAPARAEVEGGIELHGFIGALQHSAESNLGFSKSKPNTPALRMGPLVGPRLTINLGTRLAIDAELGFGATGTEDGSTSVSIFAYKGSLLINLLTGQFRPFILIGGGAQTGSSDNAAVLSGNTRPEFHWGGGAYVDAGDRYGFRGDGRAVTGGGRTASLTNDFEGLGRFYYKFGGVETKPAEPPKEEGKPGAGPAPVDGDNDGVADDKDKCPKEPEDKDGFQDDDGCPDPDNDGDKVADGEDKCPMEAGPQENGGCPDKDGDGDTIMDRLDKCPLEPETKNGFEDEDGCPDTEPVPETFATLDVKFKGGKSAIDKKSFAKLDEVVKFLTEHATISVEIGGHTDAKGKHDKNVKLSQDRADSVRAYFISKGIAGERVKAVGYGPDKPIADNKSKAGASKNRRVEMKALPPPPKAQPEKAPDAPAPDAKGAN